jgi:hypothetical protein
MNGDGVGLPLGHLPTIATVNSLLLSAGMVLVKCFKSLSSLPRNKAFLGQLAKAILQYNNEGLVGCHLTSQERPEV